MTESEQQLFDEHLPKILSILKEAMNNASADNSIRFVATIEFLRLYHSKLELKK